MEVDPDPELVPGLDPEEEDQALLPHLALVLLLAPVVVEVMQDPKLDHTPDHMPGLVREDVPGQAVEDRLREYQINLRRMGRGGAFL